MKYLLSALALLAISACCPVDVGQQVSYKKKSGVVKVIKERPLAEDCLCGIKFIDGSTAVVEAWKLD